MENYVGKTCPFCKTAIAEGDEVKVCPACGIPHHQGCWDENHGCTTFGCSEQNYTPRAAANLCTACGAELQDGMAFCVKCGAPAAPQQAPANLCTACGAELQEGMAFCAKCGAPVANQAPAKPVCPACGAELQEGMAFCAKCGHKTDAIVDSNLGAINQFNENLTKKKKKNKALPIIIAAVVAIVAIFGGITISTIQEKKAEEERLEAIAEYKSTAEAFYLKVLSSGSTMEDIGNEMKTAWKAYVSSSRYNGSRYYSVDSAIAAAQREMASSISTVKAADSSIQSMYKDLLILPDTSDQELLEIKEMVKEVYDAYQDMYDCVITPSGNYNSWTSEFSSTDSELADTIGELGDLVR